MDATITSPATQGWELLARLAQIGQHADVSDPSALTTHLAQILSQYLPSGLVVVFEQHQLIAQAAWGFDEATLNDVLDAVRATAPALDGSLFFSFLAGADRSGTLVLGQPSTNGHQPFDVAFFNALVAQIGLLYHNEQRVSATRRADSLHALVDTRLQQVGLLEAKTILQEVLVQATRMLGFESAAVYSANSDDANLILQVQTPRAAGWQEQIAYSSDHLLALTALRRITQIGMIERKLERRRNVEATAIAVPLQNQEVLGGVLAFIVPSDTAVGSTEQALIEGFANQFNLLMRNADAFSQQQQRARELFVLYENSQEINRAAQLEVMLDRAAENIALALQSDCCLVQLSENGNGVLRLAASYSETSRAGADALPSALEMQDAGPLLTQLSRGEPLWVADLLPDENALYQALRAMQCRSALLVGLQGKDDVIGLLALGYRQRNVRLSQAERNLAQVLASQVATAVLNRQMYLAEQVRAGELEQLQQISYELNADLSLDEVLDSIHSGLRSLIAFDAGRIYLYESQTQRLNLAAQEGFTQTFIEADERFSGPLTRQHRPLRVDDLHVSSLALQLNTGYVDLQVGGTARSYIAVPLRVGDELIGTLELATARPRAFNAETERLLTIVAGQSAQAITNARRFEQADGNLRARVEQLRALQRVSSQLAITADQGEILEYVLEQAIRATSASRGLIALRSVVEVNGEIEVPSDSVLRNYFAAGADDLISLVRRQQRAAIYQQVLAGDEVDSDFYVVVEASGYSDEERDVLMSRPLADSARTAHRALEQRLPILSEALDRDERLATLAEDGSSALAAPIFYEAGVVGVVMLFASQVRSFDHDAVEFLRALTHQAAVGIGNAQRYSQLKQLSQTLQRRAIILNDVLEIGQALRADRTLENVLEQVGYSVMESANFRVVLFFLAEPGVSGTLRAVAGAGIPLNELDRIGQRPLPETLALRFLDSRLRIGRSYFVPSEELSTIEAGFEGEFYRYSASDEPRVPGEWQEDDRIVVPLYATEGQLLGLMVVGDPIDRQRPMRRTVDPLEIFADQAAIAIENHNLLRDARARAEEMTALFQVGAAATSEVDLDRLLARVYEEIVAYLGTPSFFYIASYDNDSSEITFDLFLRQGEPVPSRHKKTLPRGGLTGYIIESGKPLLVQDIRDHAAFEQIALTLGEEVRSWLGVPLLSQNRVIGVLSVQDFAPNAFSEGDLQFLSALANQLAIAVEKAKLFHEREQRIAELGVINRISTITSATLDISAMLREVYLCLKDFLALDAFFIRIYRSDRDSVVAAFEVDEQYEELDVGESPLHPGSLTEAVIRSRKPLRFKNLGEEQHALGLTPIFFGGNRPTASWIGVPLLIGEGDVVGVISVQSYTPNLYGDREQSFLTTVASQLALGVKNAQLLAQAQEQVAQLQLLNRVSLVAAATLDLQRIYQEVVDAMALVTGVNQARLVLYDRKAGIAPIVAEFLPTDVPQTTVIQLVDNPAVQWLDEHQLPLVALDAQNDPLTVVSHEVFRALDIQSIAFIPMIANGELIGCVGLDFVGRSGTFSPQALELCRTIANQTSTAISNAQLFAEARANAAALETKVGELSTLLDAARFLSSLLRPEEVLNKLMELVRRQLTVSTVALWTLGEGNVLTPAAMDGIPETVGRTMRVPVGQGFTGRVAQTGQPLVVDDVNAAGGSLYPDFQNRNRLISFMGVPVVYREKIIGVLSVMTNLRREFSDDEMLLLVGLADQAATALENARLFEERERRISELSTINRISAAVNATQNQEDLLENLHRGIGEIIDVSTFLIALYDERSKMISYPLTFDNGERCFFPPLALERATGTTGWVIQHCEPLLIGSADEAHRMGLVDADDDWQFRKVEGEEQSYLVAPILFGSRVLGVISVQSYAQRAFDENDLRFLTTVANQAAVALNNVLLFSETRQNAVEMTALFEVTQNLAGTLDPSEAQQLVADAALRLLGVELCAVLRLDSQGRIASQVLSDVRGQRDGVQIRFRDSGLTALVLQSDGPVAVSDIARLDMPNPEVLALGIRGALGVAVGSPDERLGVIWVGYSHAHEWTDRQQALIAILANQAAQALRIAQLFQLEQTRRGMADTLRDVAQSFTSTLALSEIQTLILDQLARVVRYDSAAVLLRDQGYGLLQITETRGLQRNDLEGASLDVESNPLFSIMARELRPVLVSDVAGDERFAELAELGWTTRAWIGAPLLMENELVGILSVGSHTVGAYDAEDAEVAFALASQASQAIQNARLFDQISGLAVELERRVIERTADLEEAKTLLEEEKNRLEAVHAITLELTSMLDLYSIISRALELVSTNMGVSRGSIMLRDQVSSQLICRAVLYDQGDVRPAHIPLIFNGSEGLAGWVMRHQEAVCISDVRLDERWVQEQGRADEVRSVAAVPLKTTDSTLGVLILSSPNEGYFTDSQMNLLGTIANVVAAAIYNAQLYNFVNDLADQNSSLLVEQREETSKSQAILQSVTEGVIVLDADRRVQLYNPAAEQVLEIPAEVVLGAELAALEQYGEDSAERKRSHQIYTGLMNALHQVEQGQEIYRTSLDLNDPNQVIALSMSPVVGPNNQSYGDVAVLRDITREIEADEEKRRFISDVSHELRTPLTAIKGYVDVLLLSSAHTLSPDHINYLNIIKSNTNRLRNLIEEILEISRPDGKNKLILSDISIREVMEDVVQSLRLEAERKNMVVSIEVADDVPLVTADQKRVTQIVFNLFSNAVKYTYDNGRIVLRSFLNRANMLQVDVEDTGVGMSPEQRKKLFRPFYRADNPLRDVAGGTGLGLSIAKMWVEKHGGQMWVSSDIGKGSTFSFIIPLVQAEPDNEADEDDE